MSSLKYITISSFELNSKTTQDIILSYQLFGKPLNEAPIVLVNHALTGNSNVCGKEGWWSDLIGENKCIDTNQFAILAFNIPGNGYDNVEKHLIENYKDFTARTIAEIFSIGLKSLQINKLFAVIGGSVGGGIAWELAALEPNLATHLIPVASDWKSTDWLIANCHIQDSILNNSSLPLVDARMHAMTLYRTPESFTNKFQRTEVSKERFNVESWLDYHGKVLSKRFNLSAYKLMNQILKTIDITKNRGTFNEVVGAINSTIHMVTIPSDLFFKSDDNWNAYVDLKLTRDNVNISEIKSIHGHDAFLIEYEQLIKILKPIFDSSYQSIYNETLKKCL
ncbi:alpha/beta fold hydrolase [Psychroserpens ponticola]|uniref:Alpha/beta fold hydrolase n=1 Tax=Psychroserpens ponticola TaxID=2932268 RepID=A0ABY7RYB9_9FLAO|nr:alpha/beta fold hydrolase [Psychroserpens ponticola]WCO02144.1 alpha/beta fold hydrolase [Psychroserpens ponticola]